MSFRVCGKYSKYDIKTCGVSKYISSTAGCEKYKDSAEGKPSSNISEAGFQAN
jgi:hypothetical protein